jgi:hypothetical protein
LVKRSQVEWREAVRREQVTPIFGMMATSQTMIADLTKLEDPWVVASSMASQDLMVQAKQSRHHWHLHSKLDEWDDRVQGYSKIFGAPGDPSC